ncbi:MAG: OmpA family protein [Fibromonadaceae bacterium]|jgi:outer membrane protein OmpA-like peptidoglycan-associated protein|nr:OmpA family protein [Fibromonadaceae bacterium]
MKQAIIVLACAASLFAQAMDLALDSKISCRESFDEVKNSARDAASDRIYALTESRISTLESIPAEKRTGAQYEAELRSCDLSVDLFKAQLERATLTLNYTLALRDLSLVKDSLISLLDASLDKLDRDSKKALAEKDAQLNKQKEEADKKLKAMQSKTISVFNDARGTVLSMSGDILFETAKADLKQELQVNLAEVAAILKTLLNESNVIVEGHTDNVGNSESNKKLSQRRADSVKKFLIERGVESKRLKAIGQGSSKPVTENNTEEGKSKNRRVELVIKDR